MGGRYWSGNTSELSKGAISRFNYPIQASGAEGLKEALALLMDQKPSHWKLVGAVHDEIILEVPIQEAEKAAQLLNQAMTEGMQKLVKTVPVLVESTISRYWKK